MESKKAIRYKVIHTEKDIREMTTMLGEQVWENAQPNDIFICLLNGGIFFYCDLLKQMCMLCANSVKPKFLKPHTFDVNGEKKVIIQDTYLDMELIDEINEGANIWLVDEIVDSGRTLTAVIDWLEARFNKVNEGKIKTLNRLPEYNVVALMQRGGAVFDQRLKNRIIGFTENRKEWFAGYGMDGTDGTLRACPFIVVEMPDNDNDEED